MMGVRCVGVGCVGVGVGVVLGFVGVCRFTSRFSAAILSGQSVFILTRVYFRYQILGHIQN